MPIYKRDFQKTLEGTQEEVASELKKYLAEGWEVKSGELIPVGFNQYKSRVFIENPAKRTAQE